MKTILLTLITLFMSLSAYAGNQDNILGEWSIDLKKLNESEQIVAMRKNPQTAPQVGMIMAMMPNTKVVITKEALVSKILLPDGSVKERKEAYEIVSEIGNVLNIITTSPTGKKSKGTLTILDDKSLIITTESPTTTFKTLYLIK